MSRSAKSKQSNYPSPKSTKKKAQTLKVLLVVRDDIVTHFFETSLDQADDDQFSARMVHLLWDKDFISADELSSLSSKVVNFKKLQDTRLMDKVSDRIRLLSYKGGRDNELIGSWLEMMGEKVDRITDQIDAARNEQLQVYQSIYSSLMAETKGHLENPIKIPSPSGSVILKILRVSADGSSHTA
jgi:hypothetical protein